MKIMFHKTQKRSP